MTASESETPTTNSNHATMTHDHMTEQEVAAVKEMSLSFSSEEIASFPDEHMPLRHLRAEKVSGCGVM